MPLNLAAPASLSRFVESLIKNAICTGSAEFINLVYELLLAGIGSFPSRVATSLFAGLQQNLLGFLKHSDDTSMQCLGILAQIQGGSWCDIDLRTKPSPGEDPQVTSNLLFPKHDYFTTKAHKTLDFVVLKVIVALSEDEKAKDVEFANIIMKAIPPNIRINWLERKSATARKVCEKSLRLELDPQIRLSVSFNLLFRTYHRSLTEDASGIRVHHLITVGQTVA